MTKKVIYLIQTVYFVVYLVFRPFFFKHEELAASKVKKYHAEVIMLSKCIHYPLLYDWMCLKSLYILNLIMNRLVISGVCHKSLPRYITFERIIDYTVKIYASDIGNQS